MYVKHVLLDLHVYHALNVRLTCFLTNGCFTHVAHFPVLSGPMSDDNYEKPSQYLVEKCI